MRSFLLLLVGGLVAVVPGVAPAGVPDAAPSFRAFAPAEPAGAPERALARTFAAAYARLWPRAAVPRHEPRLAAAAVALAELAEEGPDGLDRSPDWLRFELARLGVGVGGAGLRSFGLRVPAARPAALDAATIAAALRDLPEAARATHVGVAWRATADGGAIALFVLARETCVLLAPFPTEVGPGTAATLRISLDASLAAPRLALATPGGAVVTRPLDRVAAAKGKVSKPPTPRKAGHAATRWETSVPFLAGAGEYRVEVVADGAHGPEVALLFPVYAGVPKPIVPVDKLPLAGEAAATRPLPAPALEAAALSMVNADRRAAGLRPVALVAALALAARAHSEEMRDAGAIAHVSSSGDPADRVAARGLAFARVTENVGTAPTLKAAHAAFLDSPAHRANLLDAAVDSVGIGIVADEHGPGARLWVTYVFAGGLRGAATLPEPGAPAPAVAAARAAEDAIWSELAGRRAAAGLPPLVRDPRASGAAADMVRAMTAAGRAATTLGGISFAELVRLHGAARGATPMAFRVLAGDGATLGGPWADVASPGWARAGVAAGRTSAPGASTFIAVALLGPDE